VDVSYLSPHVNMAARLEAATKQYGVPLLMSGDTWGLLSPDVQVLCRLIDRVTVVGSEVPVELYTYDVPRQWRTALEITAPNSPADFHDASLIFHQIPPGTTETFRETFAVAVDCYLGGSDGSQAIHSPKLIPELEL